MTETLIGRASLAALLLFLPLACSSSGGGGSPPAGGSGGSSAGGSSGAGGTAGSGGSGGGGSGGGGSAGSGGAGGSATGGAGGAGATGGTGGSQTGGSGGSVTPDGSAGSGGAPADGGPAADAAPTGGPAAYENDAQFCKALGLNCGGDTLPDKDGVYHPVYCGTCAAPTLCAARATFAGGAAGVCSPPSVGLNPAQTNIAEQLTAIWENGDTGLAYGYSEDIGDKRGFTSGRAGFCTGTGDAIVVVACYNSVKPGNVMSKYMAALTKIEDAFIKSMGQTTQATHAGLDNWQADWGTAAKDQVFRNCQDAVVDAVYYGAAMQHVAERKFTTAITKASLFDAQINQGEADYGFGMKKMLDDSDKMTGALANPPTVDDESKWLGNFHKIRAKIMYDDAETWRGNMYRVANYEKIRLEKNYDLAACIRTGQVAANKYWSPATGDPGPAKNIGPCN
jgi:hypothetical protein